ncbi:MAG TPA: beta-galactosidase, partial [Abditibacterium sp.]
MKPSDSFFSHVLHGGDYNPDQWPEAVWDDDVRLMQEAHWNIATLPVFGWVALQSDEETFHFEWLDRVLDKLHEGGIGVCLATATASVPQWLTQKYPEILTVNSQGQRLEHGGRHIFCPNSPQFKRLSTNLVSHLAQRYGAHPALKIWHVGNEYGGNAIGGRCHCDLCQSAFRTWLEARYGDLDTLNARWDTAFWGKTYTNWEQIESPKKVGEETIQALSLDYDRFQSESLLGCYRAEAAILRQATPDVPITTNMMGAFKPLDYCAWAREVDVVSWDCYPRKGASFSEIAFNHALMRGLREGQPWLLMEQTPSQQNWQAQNSLKRPGIMRLWSYQAMAHGAEAVMYFQWRRTRGGIEKFHGAVVEHVGTSQPRVFQEVAQLGLELENLGNQTLGGRVPAKVALLFDWENWWAVEYTSGPTRDLKYVEQCQHYFTALHEQGILCDIVSPDADLSKYEVV